MENNKTAIITGATSGIGSVIADHLVKSGYELFVLGRNAEKLEVLLEHLHAINPRTKAKEIVCELASFESTKKACLKIKKQ